MEWTEACALADTSQFLDQTWFFKRLLANVKSQVLSSIMNIAIIAYHDFRKTVLRPINIIMDRDDNLVGGGGGGIFHQPEKEIFAELPC